VQFPNPGGFDHRVRHDVPHHDPRGRRAALDHAKMRHMMRQEDVTERSDEALNAPSSSFAWGRAEPYAWIDETMVAERPGARIGCAHSPREGAREEKGRGEIGEEEEGALDAKIPHPSPARV
jgi:hypothetical protein